MSRASIERALEDELFGVKWDAKVCEGRMAKRAECLISDPLRTHHLVCAIDALAGAKASLARADRHAAKLRRIGGAS